MVLLKAHKQCVHLYPEFLSKFSLFPKLRDSNLVNLLNSQTIHLFNSCVSPTHSKKLLCTTKGSFEDLTYLEIDKVVLKKNEILDNLMDFKNINISNFFKNISDFEFLKYFKTKHLIEPTDLLYFTTNQRTTLARNQLSLIDIDHIISLLNLSINIQECSIKLQPIHMNKNLKLIFRGLYTGPFSQFNETYSGGETYLNNTGVKDIDNYIKMSVKNSAADGKLLFDSFSENHFYSKEYESLRYVSKMKGNFFKNLTLEDFGKIEFYNRIEHGDIILRPKTWVIKKKDFLENALDIKWRKEKNIHNSVILNIWGGYFLLNLEDRINFNYITNVFINNKWKNVEFVIIEEAFQYPENLACELTIGASFEK